MNRKAITLGTAMAATLLVGTIAPANAAVDVTAPTVSTFTPVNDATAQPVTTVPTATFSEAIQPTTIKFTLANATGALQTGSLLYNTVTRVVSFKPAANLTLPMKFTAKVWGAKDLRGNTMTATKSWVFTTGNPPDVTAPSIPGGVAISNVASTTANLDWATSTDNVGVTKYEIYNGGSLLTSVAGNPPVHTFALTGLVPSTQYALSVKAFDLAGNVSGPSNAVTFTTAAPPVIPDTTKPTAPATVAVPVIGTNTATVTWLPSTDNVGVVSYQVLGGTSTVVVNDTPLSVTANLTGLVPSTQYIITVKAIDLAGNVSDASNAIAFTTAAPPPVNLIQNPSVESGTTAPDSWSTYTDPGTGAVFTYDSVGALDGAKMLTVKTTATGLAMWRQSVNVPVTAGSTYTYQDSFRANQFSYYNARFYNSSGVFVSATDLGYANASPAVDNITGVQPTNPMDALEWQRSNLAVVVPVGATQVELQHYIFNAGTLQTDAYSLTIGAPVALPGPPVGSELVKNRGAETVSGTTPVGWVPNSWGSNVSTFSVSSDAHSGTNALRVDVANYVDGDAKWLYPLAPAVGGKYYQFTDWYKSNANSSVSAGYTRVGQGDTIFWANLDAGIAPSPTVYTQLKTGVLLPSDATGVFFAQFLSSNGYLITDEYSMKQADNPAGFNRALISLTFDDASPSQYNALPTAEQYGFKTTQYIPTGALNNGLWTTAQLRSVFDRGHEIGGHTVTHPNMTCNSTTDPCIGSVGHTKTLAQEISECKSTLNTLLTSARTSVHPVVSFASPYGAYNSTVLDALGRTAVPAGSGPFQNHRSVEAGYNGKSDTNVWDIRVQNILQTTTLAEYQSWIDTAKANNYWLVIVYHEVTTNLNTGDPEDTYNTTPTNFAQQMLAVHNSGVQVSTVRDAISEIKPQLAP